MMNITKYTDDWKVGLEKLIMEFYDEVIVKFEPKISPDMIDNLLERYRENVYLLIIDGEVKGCFAGMDVDFGLSASKYCQERFFFVNKDHRFKLIPFIHKVEKILRDKGYVALIMAYIHGFANNKLINIYEKNGFVPFETHLIKRLGDHNA